MRIIKCYMSKFFFRLFMSVIKFNKIIVLERECMIKFIDYLSIVICYMI